jgi:REP element-mobilizing transposase RayT
MLNEIESGCRYRRRLPHIRVAGGIYHVRFSIHPTFRPLCQSFEFRCVQDTLAFGHRKSHTLIAYVIMSNHTHAILQPLPRKTGWSAWCDYDRFHRLEDILRDIKKFSALAINKSLGRRGSLWRDESFDRVIRSDSDLVEVIDYIHHNPVRWGLVQLPEQYPWSSASTIYSGREEYREWFASEC